MKRTVLVIALVGMSWLVATETAQAQLLRGRLRRDRTYDGYYNYDRGTAWYGDGYYGRQYRFRGNYYNGTVQPMPVNSQPSTAVGQTPPATEGAGVSTSMYRGPANNLPMVQLKVIVPRPDARLWIMNQPMRYFGVERRFHSPPLEPGYSYSYKIKATWIGPDGKEVTREKDVPVKPGQETVVNLAEEKG